jgi:hypothetical protein
MPNSTGSFFVSHSHSAFSVWVLRRFLLLWNRKEFTALSSACFDAQEAILGLLLVRQPKAFAELIGRYVDTLSGKQFFSRRIDTFLLIFPEQI